MAGGTQKIQKVRNVWSWPDIKLDEFTLYITGSKSAVRWTISTSLVYGQILGKNRRVTDKNS